MFWIITTLLSIITIIVGIIWYHKDEWSVGSWATIVTGVVCVLLFGFLLLYESVEEKQFVTKYEILAEYTENYTYANEAEKAIIAGKKYDFNNELIDKKASIRNYSFLWINPEKIENLELLQ